MNPNSCRYSLRPNCCRQSHLEPIHVVNLTSISLCLVHLHQMCATWLIWSPFPYFRVIIANEWVVHYTHIKCCYLQWGRFMLKTHLFPKCNISWWLYIGVQWNGIKLILKLWKPKKNYMGQDRHEDAVKKANAFEWWPITVFIRYSLISLCIIMCCHKSAIFRGTLGKDHWAHFEFILPLEITLEFTLKLTW